MYLATMTNCGGHSGFEGVDLVGTTEGLGIQPKPSYMGTSTGS